MSTTKELIDVIQELNDDRDKGYQELAYDTVKVFKAKAAALFTIKDEDYWIPYSHLRHLDDEIYASDWILQKEGLT